MEVCSCCLTDPALINGPWGLFYKCPRCQKRSAAWAEHEAALIDWDSLNTLETVPEKILYPQPGSPGVG